MFHHYHFVLGELSWVSVWFILAWKEGGKCSSFSKWVCVLFSFIFWHNLGDIETQWSQKPRSPTHIDGLHTNLSNLRFRLDYVFLAFLFLWRMYLCNFYLPFKGKSAIDSCCCLSCWGKLQLGKYIKMDWKVKMATLLQSREWWTQIQTYQ